ncbi:MAG: hypothetical protein ASARMPREDX12_007672 [Alectoria sarmentosa]|nr:MAG: hypothetical protein ASARMPREDX12_007672 [Alectoria sarmentosa]
MTNSPDTAEERAAANMKKIAVELVDLERRDLHQREKTYKLQYDPGNEIPRSNCIHKIHDSIIVRDLRLCRESVSFDLNGFTVLDMKSELKPGEFYDEVCVKDVYYSELKAHGSQIRKRHPEFPVSTGGDYEFLQPTMVVHKDFTEGSALEASRDVLKVDNDAYSRIHSMWKPLHGPVTDWPLGLCDVKSVNKDKDSVASDVVSRTG